MKMHMLSSLAYRIFSGCKNFLVGPVALAILFVSLASGAEISEGDRDATALSANMHIDRGLTHMAEGGEANLHRAKIEFDFVIHMKYDIGHKSIAYLNLGVISFMEDNPEQAIKYYYSAIGLRPDYAEAYFNLGGVYYKQEDLTKAEQAFLKAVELEPNYGRAHYSLGSLYFDQKKYDLARKHAAKAQEYGVTYKTLQAKLAKLAK